MRASTVAFLLTCLAGSTLAVPTGDATAVSDKREILEDTFALSTRNVIDERAVETADEGLEARAPKKSKKKNKKKKNKTNKRDISEDTFTLSARDDIDERAVETADEGLEARAPKKSKKKKNKKNKKKNA